MIRAQLFLMNTDAATEENADTGNINKAEVFAAAASGPEKSYMAEHYGTALLELLPTEPLEILPAHGHGRNRKQRYRYLGCPCFF